MREGAAGEWGGVFVVGSIGCSVGKLFGDLHVWGFGELLRGGGAQPQGGSKPGKRVGSEQAASIPSDSDACCIAPQVSLIVSPSVGQFRVSRLQMDARARIQGQRHRSGMGPWHGLGDGGIDIV